jgi:hypothetical protein
MLPLSFFARDEWVYLIFLIALVLLIIGACTRGGSTVHTVTIYTFIATQLILLANVVIGTAFGIIGYAGPLVSWSNF